MFGADTKKYFRERIRVVKFQLENSRTEKQKAKFAKLLKALQSCLKKRKCKNPKCRNTFQPGRVNHVFCENKCAATHWYHQKKEKSDV